MNNNLFNNVIFDKDLSEEQIKLLNSQIRKYISISKLKLGSTQYQLYLDDNKQAYFPMGTLIYGLSYDAKKIKEISVNGILASEFYHQKKEDKNYYCVSLKKMTSDTLVKGLGKLFNKEENMPFGKFSDKIAFVINPSSKIGGLLYYDLLDDKFNERLDVKSIIDYQTKKGQDENSALLVGIPSNCISGIVLGEKLALKTEIIKALSKIFPNSYIISSSGHVIRDRSNLIVVEDFDKMALSSCQNSIKLKLMVLENKRLKKSMLKIINSIKDNTSYYNQAKIYLELGFDIPKGLLQKLSKEECNSLDIKL